MSTPITVSAMWLNDINDELGRACSTIHAVTLVASTFDGDESSAIMQVTIDTTERIEKLRAKISNTVNDAKDAKAKPFKAPKAPNLLAGMSVVDLVGAIHAVIAARHIMLAAASSMEAKRYWAGEQFARLDAELAAIVLELDGRTTTDAEDQRNYLAGKAAAFPHLESIDYDVRIVGLGQ